MFSQKLMLVLELVLVLLLVLVPAQAASPSSRPSLGRDQTHVSQITHFVVSCKPPYSLRGARPAVLAA